VAAPCARLQLVREPVRKVGRGRPFNTIVRPQMSYASIDSTIRVWARSHELRLFESMAGLGEVRCAYLSSARGECFQIWIDPPASGEVIVHAGDVETVQDEHLRSDWRVPVADLDSALEDALVNVQRWMVR
jgi:hypothetical protein